MEEEKGFKIDDSCVLRYDRQSKSTADLLENQIWNQCDYHPLLSGVSCGLSAVCWLPAPQEMIVYYLEFQ